MTVWPPQNLSHNLNICFVYCSYFSANLMFVIGFAVPTNLIIYLVTTKNTGGVCGEKVRGTSSGGKQVGCISSGEV